MPIRPRSLVLALAAALTLVACSGPAEVAPVSFELVVTQTAPAEPATFEAPLGAEVTIEVTSEVDEELHVHGYELEADLQAGGSSTIRFTAEMTGAFEIETHDSPAVWAKLVVR